MPILPLHSQCKIPIINPNPNNSSNFVFRKSNNHQTCCFFTTTTTPPSPFIRSRRRNSSIRASATANKDYYSSLNLSRNATLKDIKSSYRKLARQYHPDMNNSPGAEDKFKEISAAYEVLSDDEKRSLYDRYGEVGLQEQFDGPSFGSHGVDPFDVFDAYFGESNAFFGGSNMRNQSQDLDIRYDLSLKFEESIFGVQKNIEVSCFETCDNCNGSGAKSSSCVKSCVDCGGKGGVMKSQKTPFGVMSQVSTCSKCGGEGKVITEYCKKCDGHGKVQSKRSIKVAIPPGVDDGATVKVQGKGSSDKQRGIVGDLYLFVNIEEKHGIRRDGVDLYSVISVDYTEAILGTVVKVETVEGSRDLHISAGTQPGDFIKLPSMGVPNFKKPSVRGDHHFIVNVAIPKDISDTERTLVEKLASFRVNSTSSNGISESQKIKNAQNNSSLWGSLGNIFGRKQSGAKFASVSVGALNHPRRVYRCRGGDVSVVISISVIFLSIFMGSLMGRNRTELSKLQINSCPDNTKRKGSN